MKHLKRNLLVGLPTLLVVVLGGYGFTHSGLGVDPQNLPKFVTHDFVDLSRIYSVSKFRSAAGHDFSGEGETCRSMKHYFSPQYDAADETYRREHKGLPQPPDGKTDIPIYAPADGRIVSMSEEHTPIGKQISFYPDGTQLNVRLFHVWPKASLRAGQHVKGGEQIGVIAAHQGTDISVQIGRMPWNETFVSYFDVMPDTMFATYQARGLASRSDVILTKAYRDAHPLDCQNAQEKDGFNRPAGFNDEGEYIHLSGYIAPSRENFQPQGLTGPDSNKP